MIYQKQELNQLKFARDMPHGHFYDSAEVAY